MSKEKCPILVTGAHRSGTTWVGKMLCASGEAFYVNEPFNIELSPNWMPRPFPFWFFYLCPQNAYQYERALANVVAMRYPLFSGTSARIRSLRSCGRVARDYMSSVYARLKRKRPLIKDPIALLSAEWLAKRFNMRVIVMIRHPLNFASSLKWLNWHFDFAHLHEQKLLMRDVLSPFQEQTQDTLENPTDIIDQAIMLWNVLYWVVDKYRQRHPECAFVRHEDLATDPLKRFRALYDHCDLTWNDRARRMVIDHSSFRNPQKGYKPLATIKRDSFSQVAIWQRRLTMEEAARITAGTKQVASLFYDGEEWYIDV